MPPRRQRVVAGVVAFAVFAVALVFAWPILRPSGTDGATVGGPQASIVVTFRTVEGPNYPVPSGTLTVGGHAIDGTQGSYCWSFPGGGSCADAVAPSFALGDFIAVPRGSELGIAGDANSVKGELDRAGPFPFDKVEDLGTISSVISLDQPAGRYILALTAHWQQGNVPYFFPVELVDPVSTPPSGTQSPPTSTTIIGLIGAGWLLKEIDGIPHPSDARPIRLTFSAQRLGGFDGSNKYGAPYDGGGIGQLSGAIHVGRFVSAAITCSGAIVDRAREMYRRLRAATTYEIAGDSLRLDSPMGTLTFVDPLALDCSLAGGGTSIGSLPTGLANGKGSRSYVDPRGRRDRRYRARHLRHP